MSRRDTRKQAKKQEPKNFRGLKGAPLDAPRFKSRGEEAEWWESHQGEIADDPERAAEAGELMQGRGGEIIGPVGTRPTTLRLLAVDIEDARRQAEGKGLSCQTYLTMLIHEGIQRAKQAS